MLWRPRCCPTSSISYMEGVFVDIIVSNTLECLRNNANTALLEHNFKYHDNLNT